MWRGAFNKVTEEEIKILLGKLTALPHETEWFEFKQNQAEPEDIGEYLSAISNSAALHRKNVGYIVWGIQDRTHEGIGTTFRPKKAKIGNEELENWLSYLLSPRINFKIHEADVDGVHIVLFEVPPASHTPVRFRDTEFIRVGSYKKKLKDHPEKARELWNRWNHPDWSAQICESASFGDLDPDAIVKARAEYKTKFPKKAAEVDAWDDIQFLNKAKITIQGKITNTAILLLGKPEATSLISPAVARISWILKDDANQEKDYEHFGPPFLLNVDRILAKIRNLTFRHLPSGTLFPSETSQYDPWVIREALHNCIAHQDYSLRGRIVVVETPHVLLFNNVGSFLPGSVETVIKQDAPPPVYRNPFLTDAMVNMNMIDTQGGGIKRMYHLQMKRFFPLPDYDLTQADQVTVKIRGEILDEKFTRLLMERADLDLWTVILLDKVQKKIPISREEAKALKLIRAVEGRFPNLFVSSHIAKLTGQKARHIRDGGLQNDYYKHLIRELIGKCGPVAREDIDTLLMDKLPEVLTKKQKKAKIHNLLSELAKAPGGIRNVGSRKYAKWILEREKK